MNKSYALVWNQALGCWNVASELTRRRSKAGRGKVVIAAGISLLGLLGQAPAFALPTGSTVVSGSGTIQSNGQQMTIDQRSDKLVTNWNEFSVGAAESVTFRQPGSNSIALNRVIGNNGSDIQGRIDANGKVFLVNPNGVVFGKTAQVNVGGLVASTQNISDKDFVDGNYRFAGRSTAAVSNAGTLTAAEGGSVALLGARVSNNGVIQAQMGSVALGAGNDFSINFDGNGLLNLQVNSAAVDALAQNGGLLKADGGQVLMTARGADSLLKTVVNNEGTIEARTLQSKSGRITLDGGDAGIVRVPGRLDASALGGQGNGGVVESHGARVEVQLATQVDTRADGGQTGTWKIRSKGVSVAETASPAGTGSVAQSPNLVINGGISGNVGVNGQGASNGSSGPTLRTDTLSSNLATTNIELASSEGNLSVDGAVSWDSGNKLGLTAERGDLHVNGALTASGANAGLALSAGRGDVQLNDNVALTGEKASLALNYGKNGYFLKDGKAVTLSGKGASFSANGQSYEVVQNLAQLRQVLHHLVGLAVGAEAGTLAGQRHSLAVLEEIAVLAVVQRQAGLLPGERDIVVQLDVTPSGTQRQAGIGATGRQRAVHVQVAALGGQAQLVAAVPGHRSVNRQIAFAAGQLDIGRGQVARQRIGPQGRAAAAIRGALPIHPYVTADASVDDQVGRLSNRAGASRARRLGHAHPF